MHVAHVAVFEIDGGIEKPVIGAFFDEPGDEWQLSAQFSEPLHLRSIEGQSHARHRIAKIISGQAQLGKNQQLGFLLNPLANPLFIEGKIGAQVSELGVYLGNGDADRHK